jgi:hypothetical protein
MPGGESGTNICAETGGTADGTAGGSGGGDIRGVRLGGCFPRTLEAYARMERKPGKRLMGLLEERVEAISGESDSDDVSQTLL